MTKHFREIATGKIHAAGRNEARLFDGAPDGYEEVMVIGPNDLPKTKVVKAGGKVFPEDDYPTQRDVVTPVSPHRGFVVDVVGHEPVETLRRDGLALLAIANHLERLDADPERDERVSALTEELRAWLAHGYDRATAWNELPAELDRLGYRKGRS